MLPNPRVEAFLLSFYSFRFYFYIHDPFLLNNYNHARHVLRFFSLCLSLLFFFLPIFTATFVEKNVLSLLNCLYTFVKKSIDHYCVDLFLVSLFYSINRCSSLLLPTTHYLNYSRFISLGSGT